MKRQSTKHIFFSILCLCILASSSTGQLFDAEKLSQNLIAFVDNATNFIKMQNEFQKVKSKLVRIEDEDEL